MSTKACNTCGEELPLANFHVDRANPDGHHSNCKACRCVTGVRYDGRERKANRDFTKLMARVPVFNMGPLRWAA